MKLDFAAGGVRQVTVNTKSNAVALTKLSTDRRRKRSQAECMREKQKPL